jgi:YD repeat-containing protein
MALCHPPRNIAMVETASEAVTTSEKSTTSEQSERQPWSSKLREEIHQLYKSPERKSSTTDGAAPMALGAMPDTIKDVVPSGGVGADGSLSFGAVGEAAGREAVTSSDQAAMRVDDGGDGGKTEPVITRDDAGHVTSVTYPNGKSRQFGYDEAGNLNKITQPDGTTYTKDGDKWIPEGPKPKTDKGNSLGSGARDAAGEAGAPSDAKDDKGKVLGAAIAGAAGGLKRGGDFVNPQVAEDGTFTYSTSDGRNFTYTTDGKGTIKNDKDGSTISLNDSSKPTSIEYKNGDKRSFGYDGDGHLNRVTDTNGQTYTYKDGRWLGGDDKPADITNFKVDERGRFSYQNRDGQTVTENTDRTSELKHPNGSEQKLDENGRILEVTDTKNKTTKYSYNDMGEIVGIVGADGKEVKRGEDGKWSDGRSDVRLEKDGTLTYVNEEKKVVIATTDGNTRTSDKTVDQLRESSDELNKMLDRPLFLEKFNGERVNDLLKELSPIDRYLVQQEYEKKFGRKLTEDVDRLLIDDAGEAQKMLYSANLQELAVRNISDAPGADGKNQRQAFLDNMNEFMARADRDGLSNKEVADTLGQTQRLMESRGSQVTGEQRLILAQQVMMHSAHPDKIDQGGHLTCNVSDVSILTFTRRPSEAASMIADVALTGNWTAPDGKRITIPPQNLVPDAEARVHPPDDGRRSFASQIFQTTALNDIGQRWDPPKHFTNRPPESAADQGEYWTDADGKPLLNDKGEPDKFGGLGYVEIAEEVQRLTGMKDVVLLNSGGDYPQVVEFESQEDLQKLIVGAQEDGKMPLIIGVSSDDKLLGGNDKPGTEGRDSNNHVIVIRDYNPSTGMVRIDNTWGSDSDKWVPLTDLYTATR